MNKRPEPTGEYAVGTFTYTIKDDREEVLKPGTKRSLSARVYYPVLPGAVESMEKAEYMTRNMMQSLKSAFKIPLNYDKLTAQGENQTEAYQNAPKIQGAKFPLILFNHGYRSFREGNSFLCIDLASHGYVVITIAHPLEGVCTEYDDGTCVHEDKKHIKKVNSPLIPNLLAMKKLEKARGTDEELAKIFDAYQEKFGVLLKKRMDEWAKDIYAVLDYAKENLEDMIDFEKGVGLTGHSFGGAMAYYLCMNDPQFTCGANIDGALFGDYKDRIMEKPFLQATSTLNEHIVARGRLYHRKPAYHAVFRDMKHVGFSDMKFAIPFPSMTGKLDAQSMHENLCKCHVEFFDAFLKGVKEVPQITSNDVITFHVYEPDV